MPPVRSTLLLLFALVLAGLPAATASASAKNGDYNWPGMHKCGSFRSGSLVIHVYASKSPWLSCKKSRRVQKAYWNGRTVRHTRNGWDYYTLPAYPGWECTSGSGGGGCSKGKFESGYQN